MGNEVYIASDDNQINLVNTDRQIVITQPNCNTSINVNQPVTSVVEILTGPPGPAGVDGRNAFPFTGSAIISGSLIVTGSTFTSLTASAGLFSGSGAELFNIPASAVVGLALNQITTGSVSASVNLGTNAFTVKSGSITFLNISNQGVTTITGSLTVSGSSTFTNIGPAIFSGSVNITGSGVLNGANILTDAITGSLVFTSSFNAFTASYKQDSASFDTRILSNSSSIALLSGSYLASSASFDNRINIISSSYATTGSNTFVGNQIIQGNITVRGTASVDVLITNYESSSIIYASGSTKFGDTLDDTHEFTGSLFVTGSTVSLQGGSFSGSGANLFNIPASGITGLNLSQIATGSISASVSLGTGSFTVSSGSTNFLVVNNSGSVGIGTTPLSYNLTAGNPNNSIGGTIAVRVGSSNPMGYKFYQDSLGEIGSIMYQYGTGLTFTSINQPIISTIGGSEKMRLAVNGNLLLGTATDSGFKLDVNGTGRFSGNLTISGSATNSLLVRGSGTTSSTTSFLVQNNAGSSAITVTDDRITTISGVRTSINTNIIQLQPASYFSLQVGGSDIYIASPTARFATKIIVGTIASDAVASAQFQIDGTTTGFLPPRTNITSNISAPAQGLQTYLTGSTNEGLYYYSSGSIKSWTKVLNDTGSQNIAGALIITGSAGTGSALLVYKSGSTVVDIQGSQGQLFSVVDALSGSLMSVNDVSGLPILEVFSDDRVVMGTYGAPGLTVTGSVTIASGSFSGSFFGNGSGLTNISASSIVGLNLSQIATGSISASVSTGTGSFTVSSGSTSLLYVSNSGSVGIGTTNPGATLDARGIIFRFGNGVSSNIEVVSDGTTSGLQSYNNTNGILIRTLGTQPIKFATNTSTTVLTITGSSVGIGTNTPAYTLDVSGSGRFTNGLTNTGSFAQSGSSTFYGGNYLFKGSTSGDNGIQIGTTINGYTGIDWTSNNVGFGLIAGGGITTKVNAGIGFNVGTAGTTSLGAMLGVKGSGTTSSTTAFLVQNSGATSSLAVYDNNATLVSGRFGVNSYINNSFAYFTSTAPNPSIPYVTIEGYAVASSPLLVLKQINTAGNSNLIEGYNFNATTQAFFIADSGNAYFRGNVGIGTSSPAYKLDVSGSGNFASNLTVTGSLTVSGSSTFTNIGPAVFSGSITQTASTASFGGVVGIGTTTPAYKLDVNGSARATSLVVASYLTINNSSQGSNTTFNFNGTSPFFYVDTYAINIGATTTTDYLGGVIQIFNKPNLNNLLVISDGDPATGATERLRVTKGGSVLIGTSTNSARLTVRGAGATSSTTALRIENANASGSMVVLDNGNVGIGTNTPISLLQIGSGSGFLGDFTTPAVIFNNIDNGIYLDSNRIFFKAGNGFSFAADSNGIVGNGFRINTAIFDDLITPIFVASRLSLGINSGYGGNNAGHLSLITSGSSRIYVDYSGNVGIGTSTPTYKLDVSGSGNFTDNLTVTGSFTAVVNVISPRFQSLTNVNTYVSLAGGGGAFIDFRANNSQIVRMSSNGMFVGGDTTPTSRLQVRGAGTTDATTAFRVENANASSSMVVLDNGNVGIGTATPLNKLHVLGNAGDILYILADTGQSAVIGATGTGTNRMYIGYSPGTENIAITSGNVLRLNPGGSGNVLIGTATDAGYKTYISGTSTSGSLNVNDTLHVSGSKVGISTSTPAYTLDVSGSGNFASNLTVTGSLIVSGSSTFTNIGPAVFSGSITQTASTASFGGKVGIGTTTPVYALDTQGYGRFTSGVVVNAGQRISLGGSDYGSDALYSVGGAPLDVKAYYHTRFTRANSTLGPTVVEINGQTLIKGAGATSSTTGLLVQNSGATASLSVLDDGTATIRNGLTISGGETTVNATSGAIRLQKNGTDFVYINDDGLGLRLYANQQVSMHPTLGVIVGSTLYDIGGNYSGYRGVNIRNSWGLHITSTPVPSATLQADSTTQGFLQPRMTTTQKNAISASATGLQVYDSTINKNSLYNGTNWTNLLVDTGSQSISGSLELTSALTASNAIISGNVTVLGTASINTLIVNQTQLSTGSNQLGDAADDFQTLYGTVRIPTGSLTVSGSATISSTNGVGGVIISHNNSDTYFTATGTNNSYRFDKGVVPNGTVNLGAYDTRWNGIYSSLFLPQYGSAAVPVYAFDDGIGNVVRTGIFGGTNFLGLSVSASQQIGIGVGTTSITGSAIIKGSGATSSTTALLVQNSGATASLAVLDNGNVGIGTTSPGVKFQVGDSSAVQFQVASSGASIYVGPPVGNYNMNITANTIQSSNSGNTNTPLYLQPAGTGNIIIGSGGSNKVLIGTSGDAGFKLDVNGTGRFSSNLTVTGSVIIDGGLFDTTSTSSLATGSTLIYSVNTGSYTAGFFDYYAVSGSNGRAGTIMSFWLGGQVQYTDNSTPDVGNTSNIAFSMSLAGSSAQLFASASSAGWNVKTSFRTI